MNDLTVHAPGSKVGIAGPIDGVIVQVAVKAGPHVWYQVAWWDGNCRRSEWLESYEIEVVTPGPKAMTIGFYPTKAE